MAMDLVHTIPSNMNLLEQFFKVKKLIVCPLKASLEVTNFVETLGFFIKSCYFRKLPGKYCQNL